MGGRHIGRGLSGGLDSDVDSVSLV
jgi:hypothetical protein